MVVPMVLREAQNHWNNKFPFFIRKVNRNFKSMIFHPYRTDCLKYRQESGISLLKIFKYAEIF